MRAFVLSIVFLMVSPAFGQQPAEITNSIGMKLVLIHSGSFTMGSPVTELDREPFETEHEVKISKSYYLGAYEVTQDEYKKVIGSNPSEFKGAKNPVESLSWRDVLAFCKKLSDMPKEKVAEREYRLPTEAEWEYACRATGSTAYCFGDNEDLLEEYGWFNENSEEKTHPVGEKKPNRWGLYDMHGNVSEWCQDKYKPYSKVALTDPRGSKYGLSWVIRGGNWDVNVGDCRSAYRLYSVGDRYIVNSGFHRKNTESAGAGFRVVLNLPAKQPEPASPK